MTDRGNEAQERVLGWIQNTGLPLEIATASAFARSGFYVDHSALYVDPQTGEGREVDVVATVGDRFGVIRVGYVIECKSSPNPWVVVVARDFAFKYTLSAPMGLVSENISPSDAYEISRAVDGAGALISARVGGYIFRQAFSKADHDPAYAASMSAIKAAIAVKNSLKAGLRFTTCLPVVVVDAPLFECHQSSNGALSLKAVETSSFLFTAFIPDKISAVVRVATRNGLEQLISDAKRLAPAFSQAVAPFAREKLSDEIGKQKAAALDLSTTWWPHDDDDFAPPAFPEHIEREIRARNQVALNNGIITFKSDPNFSISLVECRTHQALIRCTYTLAQKSWASSEVIEHVIRLVSAENSIDL